MKKVISFISSSALLLLSATSVFAQGTISIPNPGVQADFGKILSATISLIFIVAGLATFIFLIWGGVQWITSGGDKAAVEAAQHRIQAALLGLFIVFATWAIMLIVQTFFNTCLGIGCNITIPTINSTK